MTPALPDQALASDVPSVVSDDTAPQVLGNPRDVECLDLRDLDLRESHDGLRVAVDEELTSVPRAPWHPGGGTRPGGGEWFMADGIVVARRPLSGHAGASR